MLSVQSACTLIQNEQITKTNNEKVPSLYIDRLSQCWTSGCPSLAALTCLQESHRESRTRLRNFAYKTIASSCNRKSSSLIILARRAGRPWSITTGIKPACRVTKSQVQMCLKQYSDIASPKSCYKEFTSRVCRGGEANRGVSYWNSNGCLGRLP